MADKEISALTAAGNLDGTELAHIVQAANSRKLDLLSLLGAYKNVLHNGCFRIAQRIDIGALASSADDTYAHDRWYALAQSGAIAVSKLSDVENGMPKMARLTQSQVTAQRMGYAQIVEGKDCKHLRGKAVSFRFKRFRCSAAQAIRFAVLEWTGTEDAVTSDVVLDWTSGVYTAGNFFLAANLTISGVAAQTPAAGALTDMTKLTVTLGSSFNNLIVFAWTEGVAAQNVTLDLGLAQLEEGPIATPMILRPIATELTLCQRHFEYSYVYSASQNGGNRSHLSTSYWNTTKRIVPTIALVASPAPGVNLGTNSLTPFQTFGYGISAVGIYQGWVTGNANL